MALLWGHVPLSCHWSWGGGGGSMLLLWRTCSTVLPLKLQVGGGGGQYAAPLKEMFHCLATEVTGGRGGAVCCSSEGHVPLSCHWSYRGEGGGAVCCSSEGHVPLSCHWSYRGEEGGDSMLLLWRKCSTVLRLKLGGGGGAVCCSSEDMFHCLATEVGGGGGGGAHSPVWWAHSPVWWALSPVWWALSPVWWALSPVWWALSPVWWALSPVWWALSPVWWALSPVWWALSPLSSCSTSWMISKFTHLSRLSPYANLKSILARCWQWKQWPGIFILRRKRNKQTTYTKTLTSIHTQHAHTHA